MRRGSRSQLRIVSLAPSATSILCAIGAKRLLVGVTKWCAEVAAVNGLPKLGDCWHLKSAEDIVRLRPGLVIGSVPYRAETVAKLLDQRLNFLAMNPRSLDDVYADIGLLGAIAGRSTQACKLIRRMRNAFAGIAKRSRIDRRPCRVYCEAWPNPRISSPPWVAEMVQIAGGEMVTEPGARISDEEVAATNPDVIVLAWAATGRKAQRKMVYAVAAWRGVPAVRSRRVFVVRDELLNTPGPPLVLGAKELHRIITQCKTQR